jgi:hypothetical protein
MGSLTKRTSQTCARLEFISSRGFVLPRKFKTLEGGGASVRYFDRRGLATLVWRMSWRMSTRFFGSAAERPDSRYQYGRKPARRRAENRLRLEEFQLLQCVEDKRPAQQRLRARCRPTGCVFLRSALHISVLFGSVSTMRDFASER